MTLKWRVRRTEFWNRDNQKCEPKQKVPKLTQCILGIVRYDTGSEQGTAHYAWLLKLNTATVPQLHCSARSGEEGTSKWLRLFWPQKEVWGARRSARPPLRGTAYLSPIVAFPSHQSPSRVTTIVWELCQPCYSHKSWSLEPVMSVVLYPSSPLESQLPVII